MSNDFQLGYRRWLDGLRGVAILAVLAYHFQLAKGGFLGVDLFFVLSGFLITTILMQEWQRSGAIHLGKFYLRRALRLMPALMVLFASGYVAVRLFRPEELDNYIQQLIVSALYVSNWTSIHQVPLTHLGHTWSLSLEEQFYLIWPVCLCLMFRARWSRIAILGVASLGVIAPAIHRLGLYRYHRHDGTETVESLSRIYMGLDTRADALLVGCLLALLVVWKLIPTDSRARFVIRVCSLISVAVLLWFTLNPRMEIGKSFLLRGGYTMIACLFATLILCMLMAPSRFAIWLLESPLLVFVGKLSYSLYLFHIPVMIWVEPTKLGWSHPTNTILVAVLSFFAALISYYTVERPFLRLKVMLGSKSMVHRGESIRGPAVASLTIAGKAV